ncbi:MAG: trypsin-like peptidase domain-containing protein, partial [Planctomycetes bacterium]|nr:trypsin-like peptidase domain-containing protein [Planctomycetota bacterium]
MFPRSAPRVAALVLSCLAATLAQEAPSSAAALEAQVSAAAESARARTVLVVGVVGMGSGAVITPGGRVITNAHVVAGARYALCRWADGEQRLMRRLGIDYAQDLALLEPAEALRAPLTCFTWRGSEPSAGTWVLGVGFPGGYRGDDWPVTSLGRITGSTAGNRVNGVFDYDGALRSDTPIFSGNSGGPLVDLEGHLIGLNGAAEIERASALTIPEARIKARLDDLAAGWIVLPTGLRLNPERTPLLDLVYRSTDRIARQLPERLLAPGARQANPDASRPGPAEA